MKVCNNCKEQKILSDFNLKKNICKSCQSKEVKAQRAKLGYNERTRYRKAIAIAKSAHKTFNFTKEDYVSIINQPCVYCNNFLKPDNSYGIGLDRIDNTIGYSKSNCVSCCVTCNKIRGDRLSPEETSILIDTLVQHRKSILNRIIPNAPDNLRLLYSDETSDYCCSNKPVINEVMVDDVLLLGANKKPKISDTDPNWRHNSRPNKRKVIHPTKEELEKLLWEIPTIKIAEQFGVSDSAVGKWAKTYSLKKPPRGYWAKKNSL